jgi:hypothetical protein
MFHLFIAAIIIVVIVVVVIVVIIIIIIIIIISRNCFRLFTLLSGHVQDNKQVMF